MSNNTTKQYRAIYTRPWSFLDKDIPRTDRVTVFSEPLPAPDSGLVYALRRSEETLATLVRWEERTLTATTEWHDVIT